MPIKHPIWTVGEKPTPLPPVRIASEQLLEDMIERDLSILSDNWILIGRQSRPTNGLGRSARSPTRAIPRRRHQPHERPRRRTDDELVNPLKAKLAEGTLIILVDKS